MDGADTLQASRRTAFDRSGPNPSTGAERPGPAAAPVAGEADTLVAALAHWAAAAPARTALEFLGRRTSFRELDALAGQVAAGLATLGLKAGDRLLYYARNSDDFFVLLFGAARAGVVTTPVNWRLSGREAAQIAEASGARAIFVGSDLREALRASLPADAPTPMTVGRPEDPAFRGWLAEQAPGTAAAASVAADDVVLQLYTSGTTGTPKGARLTHRAFLEPQRLRRAAGVAWDAWSPQDVTLVSMPLGHIGGARLGLLTLSNGAKAVIVPEFSPEGLLDLVEGAGVTKLFIVPTALRRLLDDPRAATADVSRLKTIFYGAAPMPLPLLREALATIGCGFVQLYGMTETCGAIAALGPEDHDPDRPLRMGSTGRALPGVELAIVDAGGRRLAAGLPGEILTRSAANMAGYHDDPAATAAALDAEGWLRTGDVGVLDADGYLTICDRLKDVVISGGENIYPAEVEAALAEHPSVAEAAVVGAPDDKWGEAVKAVVVLRPGAQADSDALIAWVRARIAPFKAPKSVVFVAALPRNAAGKILKRTLRGDSGGDRPGS